MRFQVPPKTVIELGNVSETVHIKMKALIGFMPLDTEYLI